MPDIRPLAEKLRQAGSRKLVIALARQALESYFSAFSDILEDKRFNDIYKNQIKTMVQEEEAFICQFLHQLPQTPERDDLLYQILVEPFAAMQVEDDEEMEEEDDNDA